MSEAEKKEDHGPTDKKKMVKKWRIKQNGRWFKIDRKCLKEAEMLRSFYRSPYFGKHTLNIRRSSILKMALRFCKQRGHIKTVCAHDENLLRSKLQEFDSDYLQHIKDNHHDYDDLIIDLIDAAGKLKIDSLFSLLFEDVVAIIVRKTPEDIEKIFKIRCKNASYDESITILMRAAVGPWKRISSS